MNLECVHCVICIRHAPDDVLDMPTFLVVKYEYDEYCFEGGSDGAGNPSGMSICRIGTFWLTLAHFSASLLASRYNLEKLLRKNAQKDIS